MMNNFKDKTVTYTHLVSSDIEFISKNISKECAFCICTKAVERGEVTAGDVLNLWTKKLKTVYRYENFCRSDWGFLTICCQNYFEKMVCFKPCFGILVYLNNHLLHVVYYKSLEEVGFTDDKTYNQLICWLKESSEFLESIRICDHKFHLTGICLFLDTILDLVQKSCTFFGMK